MAQPTVTQRLRSHHTKLTLVILGSVLTVAGLTGGSALLIGLGMSGVAGGVVQLVQYWGTHTDQNCHLCGSPTENALVTCDECREIVPQKAFVLECEWCEETWYSNSRIWNTLRSTLHSYRQHPDEMEEKYGGIHNEREESE